MGIKQGGFTLIEIVVATGILSTVGLIAAAIFFSSLKGGAKTEILKEVKQNGDFAISTIERMIRNAREITSTCEETGTSQASISIVNPDWQTTTFDCAGTRLASNSSYLTSEKLDVSDCSFTCWSQLKGQKKIEITFTLSQSGGLVRPEEKAEATFKTTVYTRSLSY